MKLRSLNRKKRNYDLILEVFVRETRDLVHPELNESINPVGYVILPPSQKKLSRQKNGSRSFWNSKVKLKLYREGISPLLTVVIADLQRKQQLEYLGELRIHLSDLPINQDYEWYRLYSSKAEKRFVTGSEKKKYYENQSEMISGGNNAECAMIENNKLGEKSLMSQWNAYLESTMIHTSHLKQLAIPDEQGFYLDAIDEDGYVTDSESIESEEKEIEINTTDNYSPADSLNIHSPSLISSQNDENVIQQQALSKSPNNPLLSPRTTAQTIISSPHLKHPTSLHLDSAQHLSTFPEFDTDNNYTSDYGSATTSNVYSAVDKPSTSRSKFKMKKTRKSVHDYEFSTEREVLGIIFLEIISASALPPFKSFTRTGFDMDPFVIVSFGRRVFRTSWRSHTLQPIFNERLAFEVLPFEKNYEIKFDILDKDHFSFHDKVAMTSIPAALLLDEQSLETYLNKESSNISLVDFAHDINVKRKKKLIGKNPNKNINQLSDKTKFKTFELSLELNNSLKKLTKKENSYDPILKIRARFEPYDKLRKEFWKNLLINYDQEELGSLDILQLDCFLQSLGSGLNEDVICSFFYKYNKNPWIGDSLTLDEVVECLEGLSSKEKENYGTSSSLNPATNVGYLLKIKRCPICNKKRLSDKQDLDIITHVAICASKDWSTVNKLLKPSYASQKFATKRWYSKALIKLTYGKYGIGKNSANILVQDRNTGYILEEKMNIYVRLGIRIFYKSIFDKTIEKNKMKKLLKNLSYKQGAKFDSVQSASQIASFIQFHRLDLSDCLYTDIDYYKTFNEFFFRRLKAGARPLESSDPLILTSPADSRCTVFDDVLGFTIEKLFYKNGQGYLPSNINKFENGSIGIFRLAPQDYHRFHSPCDGIVGEPKFIEGEYFTVNPMAVRSELDVFGENIRCIIPIETKQFGTVIMIPVGAMLVASIRLTVKAGDAIKRGDEVGYFKFGGSTILLVFEKNRFKFDSDLIKNSKESIETLVRVGMSIGHHPSIEEYKRELTDFNEEPEESKLKIIRTITGGGANRFTEVTPKEEQKRVFTGGDGNMSEIFDKISLKELSWEASNLSIDEEDEILLKGLDVLDGIQEIDDDDDDDDDVEDDDDDDTSDTSSVIQKK
ncbi:hypothetical protein PACTADRAFT_50906 [Pachysolen tannophilus NRRL Y-2460]|uniref:phosphatidylserine decarboxylase n=1 Tax=Pachysolen tannophilus NRRL Y-2460 TaxID=669874 RepID=A0A1E4TTN5_PACTA|nr:hypothetical protein PACTADRAFT_50906 [Pachysolen tannophilus NRRL Y-2460]